MFSIYNKREALLWQDEDEDEDEDAYLVCSAGYNSTLMCHFRPRTDLATKDGASLCITVCPSVIVFQFSCSPLLHFCHLHLLSFQNNPCLTQRSPPSPVWNWLQSHERRFRNTTQWQKITIQRADHPTSRCCRRSGLASLPSTVNLPVFHENSRTSSADMKTARPTTHQNDRHLLGGASGIACREGFANRV